MKKWQVLPTISAPMPFQMALDGVLFDLQKQSPGLPQLRFYVSSEPWISVGCSFRGADRRADSSLIQQFPNLPVCHRVTGGGCVLHGRDLIFSLVARLDQGWEGLESVRTSYGVIHQSVKMAYEKLGMTLTTYNRHDDLPKGSDCFEFPVVDDLGWNGCKIAGGAQKRSESVLLHHESIQLIRGVAADDLAREISTSLEHVFSMTLEPGVWDTQWIIDAQLRVGRNGRN